MKTLSKVILSAAIVPVFALSTAAIAGSHDEIKPDDKPSNNTVQQTENSPTTIDYMDDEKRAGEPRLSGKPSSAFYATDVIGNNVKHRGTDEDIGEVNDLIIGQDGRIVGVVVTTSGFLGLGGQDAGLSWNHIEHSMVSEESVFYTEIEAEVLRDSPKYERH
ncbi:MAG: PRC-barrel domain-containing protein [Pseudomonadota bacterium]